MTISLLHTADWQIGSGFSGFDPEDSVALTQARLDVVTSIAKHAETGGFDVVLVAGDVFDTHTVSDRTIRRLFQAITAYEGPWVFIPGNHDAALVESVWTRAQHLGVIPSNAYVVLEPKVVLLDDLRLAILAAPLTQRHTSADTTAWFDQAVTPEGYYRVGLAHGSVQGVLAENVATNNPISEQRCTSAKLDYLALGDWHGLFKVNNKCWYSGTPETDRFRNNESGFVLEVVLSRLDETPKINPKRIGQYNWKSWDINLSVPSDLEVLIERLLALDGSAVLGLSVSGSIDLQQQSLLNNTLGEANANVRALRSDLQELRVRPTSQDISNLNVDGYLTDVLQSLLESAQDGNLTADESLVLLADILNEVRHAG